MKYSLFLTILLSLFAVGYTFNLSYNKNYNKRPNKCNHKLNQQPFNRNYDSKNKKVTNYLEQKQKENSPRSSKINKIENIAGLKADYLIYEAFAMGSFPLAFSFSYPKD
tara:strand:- start:433 stop:759 length:327 start_codon:yes stop_codon:yes gene_type:complete